MTAPLVLDAQPQYDIGERTEVMVPMRDGVRLATDVTLPEGDGPWPTVVERTTYGKGSASAYRFIEHGYAFVSQDQRGLFESEGTYVPHENERADGYDTIEWIAAQPWSNGRVGITGYSALGIAANLAASADPPHLQAAFVMVAPESLFWEGRFIGGMWKDADSGGWLRARGLDASQIAAYQSRARLDQRWLDSDFVFHRHNVDIPMYQVGGWYDLFVEGTLNNFRYLQEWGRPGARGNQKVSVGAFGHGGLSGDLYYQDGGRWRTVDLELRWFDYWLKDIDNGIMDEPPVRWYQRGSARRGRKSEESQWNRWLTADSWPPNGSKVVPLYLSAGGELSFEKPTAEESMTTYRYDPARPVPTRGGLNLNLPTGPMDQREIGRRPDYLRFQTGVLTEDLVLAGELAMQLFAATDGPDTDFMVKVVDVYPDGYEALILDAGLRARFRHGRRPEDVRFMSAGEPDRLDIDLWHTGITIEKGHRLAVHITSSNAPRFDVNRNNGAEPGDLATPARVATNSVFHDRLRPSALLLPIWSPHP